MREVATDSELQAVIFTLMGESYALPVGQVREVLRLSEVTPLPKTPAFVEGVIHVRGRALIAIDLRKRFELEDAERTGLSRIIIVRTPKALVGLIVDRVEGITAFPREAIEPLSELAVTSPVRQYLSGIARSGNRLILLMKLTSIVSTEDAELSAAVGEQPRNSVDGAVREADATEESHEP